MAYQTLNWNRFSWQSWMIQPIAKTMAPQILAHNNLWLCVFGTNGSHILVTLVGSLVVRHESDFVYLCNFLIEILYVFHRLQFRWFYLFVEVCLTFAEWCVVTEFQN